jgi:hypothetical protein
MSVESQPEESPVNTGGGKTVIKAVGIGAVGATVGWLSAKGYEQFTGSNLEAMGETMASAFGALTSYMVGTVMAIESVIHQQPKN